MKTIILRRSSIFITVIFICVSTSAQSFHYDTIPDSNKNQRRLYKYEYPSQQQDNPVKQQTPAPVQEKTSGFDKSKLTFGGALGLSFGSNYTAVNIAPQIGYQFNQYLAAGGGISYNYYSYSAYRSEKQSQSYFGLNLYGRITPVSYIALQVQPEIYRMWASYLSESRVVPCMLVGGGVIMPVGARGGISMMIYYDLIQDDYSPYHSQLVYSVGYVLSF